MHFDVSKAMEQRGWNATYIHAGKHKVDGNPYEALPDDVKARIQARIDDLYGIFVKTVARNRGLEEQAVRDTEALTYSAPDALSVGLADKIGPFDDALADFSASLNPNVGDETMADTFSQADIDAAVATATANHAAELAAARSDGATAERARINDILASDVGKDRPKAALSAALKTGMDLETATAFLAELPKESAAATETIATNAGAPQGMLDAAMDNSANPNIEAQTGSEQSDDDLAIEQSFGGRKAKKAA
jgi:ClpP class serine protease